MASLALIPRTTTVNESIFFLLIARLLTSILLSVLSKTKLEHFVIVVTRVKAFLLSSNVCF